MTMKFSGRPPLRILALGFSVLFIAACVSGFKKLNVVDFTDQRIGDLSITRKVTGKREFLFFSTVRTGLFLEGSIQGLVTDYVGNPIEGVTVRVMSEKGRPRSGAETTAWKRWIRCRKATAHL